MLNIIRNIIAPACLLLLAGCATGTRGDADGTRRLAVSIEPLRGLLEPLAAGRFDITTVMDRGGDPESFEPSMSSRMAVDRAEALFVAGGLPFEQTLTDAFKGDEVVKMADVVEPVYGTHDNCGHAHHHGHDHDHGLPDPHVWTSIRSSRAMAAAMAAKLTELDPEGAPVYAARLDSLDRALAAADSTASAILATAPSHAFMLWHPSLSYLARDYGLQQVALGAEGKDFSAAGITRAIDKARDSGARVFLVQRGLDPRQAQSVAAGAGVRTAEIDPMAHDIAAEIINITHEIARQ
ncbi:MAG: zinc ABC transporter substrate-binding protein [Muribaculaceae bacterium]|nr:zinc ABC transporter substrate-binding protein [Muribaculaceae bacterium]